MHSTDEWLGVYEQITAERTGGFDDGYSDWVAQGDGVHEHRTLEHRHGAVTKPEYEPVPVRDPETGKFVWGIREIS
jgi:hypothetical protein